MAWKSKNICQKFTKIDQIWAKIMWNCFFEKSLYVSTKLGLFWRYLVILYTKRLQKMHSLQFCKKKYEYPTLNMLWDIREILLFIFKTVDSRRSGLKGSFQKKDYWLHQLRNKKVRNSQLLIFEKNGLVWPADIWPAHFFKY